MGAFHVFKIVQMVPNCATHHIFSGNCKENINELIYSILQPKFGDNLQGTQKS